ncbi:MAG TPA: biotin transporter BioY [Motilibacteraceae bacterium]|nr:biotin transporter BioY [Motilibacteraceae bacterium]
MAHSSAVTARPMVLADVLPRSLARDAALVVGFAGLTGLAAQVSIPLGFTPVPLTLQTFAVLTTGAALGARRALAAIALYAVAGVAGVPWFAGGQSGLGGASFGYVLGFVLAAVVVGAIADRGATRSSVRTLVAFVVGSALVYAVGVPWLAASLGVGLGKALSLGAIPFLAGDVIKALAAAGLLPLTWKLVERIERG